MNKNLTKKLLTLEDDFAGEAYVIKIFNKIKFSNDIMQDLEDVVKAFAIAKKLEVEAAHRLEVGRVELNEFYSALDERAREYEISGRATDQKVKAYIQRDAEYVERKKYVLDLELRYDLLSSYSQIIKMKADVLRTKAASERQENYNSA